MGYWGKIIGGVAGFAVGGPMGAVVGAALGHAADSGAVPNGFPAEAGRFYYDTAQAAGVAAILAGARVQHQDDDSVLRLMTWVLDCLYSTYSEPANPGGSDSSRRVRRGKVKAT